jgi:hypothetical protein
MWWARLLNVISGLLGGGAPAVTNSYESIATFTLSGSQATVDFTSIPSTYKHLQLRIMGKATASGYLKTTFNGSSTGYADHYLDANGSSVSAGADTSASYISTFGAIANTTANVFGVTIIDILDYTNTNKNKTMRALSGVDYNGSGGVDFSSGLWTNTSAINQVTLTLNTGSFAQYSSFALYGIKG